MRIESDRYKEALSRIDLAMEGGGVANVRAGVHITADEEESALLEIDEIPHCSDEAWTSIWDAIEHFIMLLRDDLQRHIDDLAMYTWPVWGDIEFTSRSQGVIVRSDGLLAEPKDALPVDIKIDYSGLIAID